MFSCISIGCISRTQRFPRSTHRPATIQQLTTSTAQIAAKRLCGERLLAQVVLQVPWPRETKSKGKTTSNLLQPKIPNSLKMAHQAGFCYTRRVMSMLLPVADNRSERTPCANVSIATSAYQQNGCGARSENLYFLKLVPKTKTEPSGHGFRHH